MSNGRRDEAEMSVSQVERRYTHARRLGWAVIHVYNVAHLGRINMFASSLTFSVHTPSTSPLWRNADLKTHALRPIAKQQAYTLAIVRPPDTLRNGGPNVDSDELGTRLGMSFLRNGVRDLPIPKQ